MHMLQDSVRQREVNRRFHVSPSTISRLNRTFMMTGSTNDRPKTGKHRVTTRRQDKFIRQRHLRDRLSTEISIAAAVVARYGRPIHARPCLKNEESTTKNLTEAIY